MQIIALLSMIISCVMYASEITVQRPQPISGLSRLKVANAFMRADLAREMYEVDGKGLCAVVIDTGIRKTHDDFGSRVVGEWDFVNMDSDASDDYGHGTFVSGIIVANGINKGIAPEATLVSLKVLDKNGFGLFSDVERALRWAYEYKDAYNIAVVNLSLGAYNLVSSSDSGSFSDAVNALYDADIPVVVSAGNDFCLDLSKQGMGFPAILSRTISVGAVYAEDVGRQDYKSLGIAYTTGPERITPFSQRLSETLGGKFRTDIFAVGGPTRSSYHLSDKSSASMVGTSVAAPIISGIIILMQQYHIRRYGKRANVNSIEAALRNGIRIMDGDDEDDNVINTMENYRLADAFMALVALESQMISYPIMVRRLDIGMRFYSPDRDKIRLMAELDVPELLQGYSILTIGNKSIRFWIDEHGNCQPYAGRLRRLSNGKLRLGMVARLNLSSLGEYGLVNDAVKNEVVTMPLELEINRSIFECETQLNYRARTNIKGKAVLKKNRTRP